MAKKNRRQKISNRDPQSNSMRAADLTGRSNAKGSSALRRDEFSPDYTYVKRDLTRIGSLAGFFIVVLIVLSFFLK